MDDKARNPKGAGRKPLPPERRMVTLSFRLPSELKTWALGKGGSAYIAELIQRERDKEPKPD